MSPKLWYLKQTDLFSGLPTSRLKKIENQFTMKLFSKGNTVYESNSGSNVYIVKSGKVEISKITANGQKFIVDVLEKGSLFGNTTLEDNGYSVVETLSDSYICYLDKDKFFNLVSKEPDVAKKLMKNLYSRLVATENKAASMATDNAYTRFIKLLLGLGKKLSGDEMVTDAYTHEQLANMLGVSRQTMTTIINRLEKSGKIRRDKKKIIYTPHELSENF